MYTDGAKGSAHGELSVDVMYTQITKRRTREELSADNVHTDHKRRAQGEREEIMRTQEELRQIIRTQIREDTGRWEARRQDTTARSNSRTGEISEKVTLEDLTFTSCDLHTHLLPPLPSIPTHTHPPAP